MRSCMNCRHTEETIFDDARKCVNEESVYSGIIVDSRELCRYWEAKDE